MESIKNEEFKKVRDKALIIDVRTEMEFKSLDRIEGAINVPINDFVENFEKIVGTDKNKLIVTICNGGNRSGYAASLLRKNGYKNAFVLERGIYGFN